MDRRSRQQPLLLSVLLLGVLVAGVLAWWSTRAPAPLYGPPGEPAGSESGVGADPASMREPSLVDVDPGRQASSAADPTAAVARTALETPDRESSALQRKILTGRIVEPGSDEPVKGASVRVDVGNRKRTTGADGRFEIDLHFAKVSRFRLTVQGPGGRGARTQEYRPRQLGGFDVGDVELAPHDTLNLLVIDDAGRAIPGARVRPGPLPGSALTKTHDDGRVTLYVPRPGFEQVRVGAKGKTTRVVTIPDPLPEELRVVLRAGARLTVHIATPSKGLTEGMSLALESEHALFPSAQAWRPDELMRGITSRWSSSTNQGPWGRCWFPISDRGSVHVQSPVLGEPIRVSIVDELGASVIADTISPLEAGEHREHTLQLRSFGRPFIGRVLDTKGRPIEGVDVTIDRPKQGGTGESTNEDGQFRFENLHASSLDLYLTHPGYASMSIADYSPPADGTPVEFRLGAGREVRVSVHDELGTPITKSVDVEAHVQGAPYKWDYDRDDDEGNWWITDLPRTEFMVTVVSSGRRFEQRVGVDQDHVAFVLPVGGSVRIDWELGEAFVPGVRHRVGLRSTDPGQRRIQAYVTPGARSGRYSIAVVHPGEYEAYLVRKVIESSPVEGQVTTYVDAVPPHPVTVVAGTHLEVRLQP